MSLSHFSHRHFEALFNALIEGYGDEPKLERMLLFKTGKNLALIKPLNANMQAIMFEVIKNAQAEGWLEMLIVGAHHDAPHLLGLRHVVQELLPNRLIQLEGGNHHLVVDPLEAVFLDHGRKFLFIGRDDLRRSLKNLVGDGLGLTPKILTIHSDLNKCGKTYSFDFIKYFALSRQEQIGYIDLKQEVELGHGLKEFFTGLCQTLLIQTDAIPDREEKVERWIHKLVQWLMVEISNKHKMCWLVIDSINQVTALPVEIEDFLKALAMKLDKMAIQCRLVLISYEGRRQLPPDIRHKIESETITSPLSEQQLNRFFELETKRLLGDDGDLSNVQAVASTLSATVMAELEQLPLEERPFKLSEQIVVALKKLEASIVETEEDV